MTIYIDPSELRSDSTMPSIPNSVIVDGLEEITGADFMVSISKMPATNETLIRKHVANGALLVQRKHGLDLASSIGTRINSSLAKMQAIGARQPQCILLFVGIMICDREGVAHINKQDTHQKYFTVQAAISKFHDRGGVYEEICRASLIQEWCRMKTRHLNEYVDNPIKQIMSPSPEVHAYNEFLQTVVLVDDGRKTLVSLPGIGPKTANLLWEAFNGHISDALCWLTMQTKDKRKIKGLGPKTSENVREYLGLDENAELSISYERAE